MYADLFACYELIEETGRFGTLERVLVSKPKFRFSLSHDLSHFR